MAPSRGGASSARKGTGGSKKSMKNAKQEKVMVSSKSDIPLELQQRTLDIFKATFRNELSTDVSATLQKIKQHLYNREFSLAFGCEEYLRVYCARWSPSRALGYLQVLSETVQDHLDLEQDDVEERSEDGANASFKKLIRATCLGAGGGAEIAGFVAHLQQINSSVSDEKKSRLDLTIVDIADWSPIVRSLRETIIQPPNLSAYASGALKANNVAFAAPESFACRFHQSDLLQMDFAQLQRLLQAVDLVTLMFTLNELYSTSLAQTQRFLLQLGNCLKAGALFLVVDSPGNYSTIQLNGKEKRYPMQWLLDHTLLPDPALGSNERTWEKLVSDESRWFRLPEGLKYPIALENMRYQIHLYRKL
ncbi:MAG: hypothetical protein Q9157_000593 [Trypethelium eluteriae]